MTTNPRIETANVSDEQYAPTFGRHLGLILNASKGLRRNPVRSIIVVLSLMAILSPFVTAIAICEGIKVQYSRILEKGCDVYVTRDIYGSNAPIELDMMDQLQSIQGVTRVTARVIGRTYVRGKFMAVLGISPESIPSSIQIIKGKPPRAKGEVIIGESAADYLDMKLGARFSITKNPKQVFRIVGLFRASVNIWNTDLLITDFEDASLLFGMSGSATDLLVYTRPGYEQIVDLIIHKFDEAKSVKPSLRVQTRDLIERYSRRGFNMKAGVFAGFYCLVFALGIPSLGVISGFGLSERRREIGVMKAMGWQTEEVLEMVALENLILSLISMPCIVLAAVAWIHVFNGVPISKFFIANLDLVIPFPVPSRIFPIPFVLIIMMSLILTMVGSIYSTWRTAIIPPSEAMKT